MISIVIPTYNHAHFIGRCLESVIGQEYGEWEAIVVNNFSKDNTIDVVESFKDDRIKLVNFSNNGVIAASRNEGIRQSKGDWVAFLDSDDWWYPTKLKECSRFFGDYDFIYHNLDIYTAKGKSHFWKIRSRIFESPIFNDLLMKGNQVPNSSVVVKKEILDRVGPLDEAKEMFAVEDFDLWLRISEVTEKFYYLKKFLGVWWVEVGSCSQTTNYKNITKTNAIFDKHIGKLSGDDIECALAQQKYMLTRERMKLGEPGLSRDFLSLIPKLKRKKFAFNAFVFGIISIFLKN